MILRAIGLAALALPATAQTDLTNLSASERAAFHEEIRSVLLENPELASRALSLQPPLEGLYADEIDEDLRTIASFEKRLFDNADFAFIIGNDCPSCSRAKAELDKLARSFGLEFNTLKIEDHPDIAKALGLDTPPFYIFPQTVLRGNLPAIVLEPYLARLSQG